jgi:hypothetical protein
MSDARATYAGLVARGLVFGLFVGGAVAAFAADWLLVAGGAFLAGYTVLAAAAVVHGQRRRGLGLSLSGVGWFLLALGVALGPSTRVGTPVLAAGFGCLLLGTAAVVRPLERMGIGGSPGR